MSRAIEMSCQRNKLLPNVTVLRITGVIDSDTATIFEKELETLWEEKHYRLLVDLANVNYVSSAGVGIFVGMLQKFREKPEGDMKICRVSPKIMKVFEAIGLDHIMEFIKEESDLKVWKAEIQIIENFDHFHITCTADDKFSGEEFNLRVEARDANRNLIDDYMEKPRVSVSDGLVFPRELSGFQHGIWEGPIAMTGTGQVEIGLSHEKKQSVLKINLKARPGQAEFPVKINCRTCRNEVKVKASDIYRCEECDETFLVDAWAHVFTIKPGSTAKRRTTRYKGMELKINADFKYIGVIRRTISGLCEQEGMDEETTNTVALAIEEILHNLVEHGNDFDPWQIFRIRLDFQKKQLKIQIRDYGDPFDVTKQKDISLKSSALKGSKRGVGNFLVNQMMDSVKYESLKNYNQLTMLKYYDPLED
ncbi:anti-sigma factor antagonist [bacterium]|nr:anti-sigma factor antagonist [bacterium]